MRDERYDVVKGIAIVLMVVGHAACAKPLHDFIYLFHMPVFFILAGWFYKRPDTVSDWCRFVWGKVKRLWFPFVFWCLLFVLLHNVLLSWHIYPDATLANAGPHGKVLYEPWSRETTCRFALDCLWLQGGDWLMMAPLWFLKVLFLAMICYVAGDCALSFLHVGELLRPILMAMGTTVVVIATNHLHIGKVIILESYLGGPVFAPACCLVSLGALLKGLNLSVERLPKRFHLCLAVTLLTALVVLSRIGTLELCANEYPGIVFMIASSLIGWSLLLLIGGYVFPGRKIMVCIGRHTMAILILHVLVFRVINAAIVWVANEPAGNMGADIVIRKGFWWCILYCFAGVLIPLALARLWQRTAGLLFLRGSRGGK